MSLKSKLTFDSFLEDRIGFGKYQITALFFLCLVDFNDGVELLSMSIIMPIIKMEWGISVFWIQVLSSIFYFGMLIGALWRGKVSDKNGRKDTILYATVLQFIIGCSFALVNNMFLLFIIRIIYGFCYGFSLPLTISMVSEILPLKYRGKCIVFTNFCVSIGKVYGIILAWLVLDNLDSGNWRFLMVLCSLSSLVVVIGMVFYVKESPRFLLSVERNEEGINILNYIGRTNKEDYVDMKTFEIKEIIKSQKLIFNKDDQANPIALFSEKSFGIRMRLWII